MAGPVWLLSVDLQTKTATFTTGLADAAKGARGSFQDIKSGANEMGRETSYSMMEARHSVMMLGEEFGVHLPRALAGFIAGLGPIGAALEAAFPFLAIIGLATILIEKLSALREAGIKLTEDQEHFEAAVNSAFGALDNKLLQAQIKADELRNDHLGALALQLELIDHQSMADLVHAFTEVAKAAEPLMKDLEGHWYTFGKGSEGAKQALDEFQAKYTTLMSSQKDEDADKASGLLHGTAKRAQKVLGLMEQLQTAGRNNSFGSFADPDKFHEADAALTNMGIKHGEEVENQIKAQQNFVNVLNATISAEERAAAIKSVESGNATKGEANAEAGKAATAARQAAESKMRLSEMALAVDKSSAEAAMTISRATLEERLSADIDFANRDRDIKLTANAAEIAALEKFDKDYQNKLKALHEKGTEIQQEAITKVSELKSKASVEENARDLRDLEQSIREKIEATGSGDAQRLAVIDAAIKTEQDKHLQDTAFYRELMKQRVQITRQMAEEESKLSAEAGKEAADNALKSGEMVLAARRLMIALEESTHRQSIARQMSDEVQNADLEYNLKMAAYQKEAAALDKNAKDYENKLKAIQDKEKQLTQQHENDITNIKINAEIQRNLRIASAEDQLQSAIASGLTQSIMRHESWSKMAIQLGDQVIQGMLQNVIKSMLMEDMTKEKDAAHAARMGFNAGMHFPFPANIAMAPILAAGAFAAVMAFEGGTDSVPGVGRGDVIPSMLSPGEGVVPGGVMDGLRTMAKDGGFNQRPQNTVHIHMTNHVNTIDGDGMAATLDKHADTVQQHVEKTLRKMNK
jgi:hypothetical protein